MNQEVPGALERIDRDEALARLTEVRDRLRKVLDRVSPQIGLSHGARILDIGAAQGLYVSVLRTMGYDAHGVEPWAQAVELSVDVASHLGVAPSVVIGTGEEIPFEDESFDLVIAISVIEHAADPEAMMTEAARVLRSGGGFYLTTISTLHPRQPEIRRMPLFPWYPQPLKRRIMDWARDDRPALVNHTTMPAYNWYSPAKMSRLLIEAGFSHTQDRWDLKRDSELSGVKLKALHAAQRSRALKFIGDVAIVGLGMLAIK